MNLFKRKKESPSKPLKALQKFPVICVDWVRRKDLYRRKK